MNDIIGIGYEGQTLDAFISKLRLRDVETLVDVRLNAISRKRGFSKTALSTALREAGIEYLHLPALGNHRDNRGGYAAISTPDALEARSTFRASLATDSAVDALSQVIALAREQTIALFCFEADENHCHRQQVREALEDLRINDLVAA